MAKFVCWFAFATNFEVSSTAYHLAKIFQQNFTLSTLQILCQKLLFCLHLLRMLYIQNWSGHLRLNKQQNCCSFKKVSEWILWKGNAICTELFTRLVDANLISTLNMMHKIFIINMCTCTSTCKTAHCVHSDNVWIGSGKIWRRNLKQFSPSILKCGEQKNSKVDSQIFRGEGVLIVVRDALIRISV